MTDIDILAHSLALEARSFSDRQVLDKQPVRSFVVADFEYSYDLDRHHGYTVAEGRDEAESRSAKKGKRDLRWPFHHIVAASWVVIHVTPGCPVPEIEVPVVIAGEMSERDIAARFFEVLDSLPAARLLTWGGETKDIPVLRRCAADFGLVLPPVLRDLSPFAPSRLDLCNATSTQADCVHLPEYAAACSIPAKPSPSKSIGMLVQQGVWRAVMEQVLADVLTTAVIGLRHLASHGVIAVNMPDTCVLLTEQADEAMPGSNHVQLTMKCWARGLQARAALRGVVYRAA